MKRSSFSPTNTGAQEFSHRFKYMTLAGQIGSILLLRRMWELFQQKACWDSKGAGDGGGGGNGIKILEPTILIFGTLRATALVAQWGEA